jgi:hypothetical protein
MVIIKVPGLIRLDGNRISNEERAWGRVTDTGGSFDEAGEAEYRELKNMRMKNSQAKAARVNSQAANGSEDVGHSAKRSIGSSFKEGIKRAFGIVDSARSSASYVSFSTSMRDPGLLLGDSLT